MKEGLQAEGFSGCSPSESSEVPEEVPFFLLGPGCSGLLRWGLLRSSGNFSLLSTFEALTSLAHFPLLFYDITRGHECKSRSWWSGHYQDN